MIRVSVDVPERSYPVLIENGLLKQAGALLREIYGDGEQSFFIITVPVVRRKWGRILAKSLSDRGYRSKVVEMPDGERHKKLETVELLADELTRLGVDRGAKIIAFGGGVVGDVAGLVASLYMRGIDVIQIPTTVVAQADAAIGGKTGVNLRAGKNLIGTFHQPRLVLVDPSVLASLPVREFRAGIFEVMKCGVIGNAEMFEKLERVNAKELRRDESKLQWAIAESTKLKAEIVSADERESGLRRVLNFGHTIGHALEADSGYRRFLHGEAVAWGMIAATDIAARMGRCHGDVARRIRERMLSFAPLPKVNARSRDILRLLRTDKKTVNGVVNFVLPREIGKVEVVNDVPEAIVVDAVNGLRSLSARDKHRGHRGQRVD
jgi:3-dehydroquinate synthase